MISGAGDLQNITDRLSIDKTPLWSLILWVYSTSHLLTSSLIRRWEVPRCGCVTSRALLLTVYQRYPRYSSKECLLSAVYHAAKTFCGLQAYFSWMCTFIFGMQRDDVRVRNKCKISFLNGKFKCLMNLIAVYICWPNYYSRYLKGKEVEDVDVGMPLLAIPDTIQIIYRIDWYCESVKFSLFTFGKRTSPHPTSIDLYCF